MEANKVSLRLSRMLESLKDSGGGEGVMCFYHHSAVMKGGKNPLSEGKKLHAGEKHLSGEPSNGFWDGFLGTKCGFALLHFRYYSIKSDNGLVHTYAKALVYLKYD